MSAHRVRPIAFDWGRLGVDEGGLPAHLPMAVDKDGNGPEDEDKAHHYECWCPDPACPLTRALLDARLAGLRSLRSIT